MAGQTIGKVVAGGKTHTVTSTFYGTCATAAATALKEVIINEINTTEALSFINGMTLTVKFTNANSHATPTMTLFNNSGTAAAPTKGSTTLLANKQIMRYGTTKPGTNASASWNAGSVVSFVYDGTYWQMVGWINNNDNTVPSVYISTAAATAAKVGTLTSTSWASTTQPRVAFIDNYYTNTAAAALTLNVNSHGAKPVYLNGEPSSATNYTWPHGTYVGYFDGTNWYINTNGTIPVQALPLGEIEEVSIGTTAAPNTKSTTKIWIEI